MPTVGAQQSPIYQPAMRQITAITQANPVVVTTSFDHNYFTGDVVRIVIPIDQGMRQLNQQYAAITVLSPTTFSMPIDGTGFEALTIPATAKQAPQAVPVGEANNTTWNSIYNTLPTLVRVDHGPTV